ncbi:MAG TPA: Na+/H+ antiporter NhaA, partial [Sphingomonas sp.]|nr:Na+/H+ antiporter NhaA [Sphingomonas sp.]
IGKQAGIFGSVWIAARTGFATPPGGATWTQIYGVAMLCGIGFTMSLFIGGLAFPDSPELIDEVKIGVLAGSVLSAVAGFLVLRFARPWKNDRRGDADIASDDAELDAA